MSATAEMVAPAADAPYAASRGEKRGLDNELTTDIAAAGPHRAPQADFADPIAQRGQHATDDAGGAQQECQGDHRDQQLLIARTAPRSARRSTAWFWTTKVSAAPRPMSRRRWRIPGLLAPALPVVAAAGPALERVHVGILNRRRTAVSNGMTTRSS